MTLTKTVLLGFGIWLVWTLFWLFITLYICNGAPSTWGRFWFALFGPIIGLAVATFCAILLREEREKAARLGLKRDTIRG